MLSPGLRKFAPTAHVVCSVGWIGAVASFLALAIAGTALAALAIWLASGLLASRTYGVSPTDSATVAASIAVVVALALGIVWLPARRATGTDPAITLRSE